MEIYYKTTRFTVMKISIFGTLMDDEDITPYFGDNEVYNSLTSFEIDAFGGSFGIYFRVILVDQS